MSGELEAAGAMATAGLVAGAIEGSEGGPAGEGACLNCGAKVDGRFCAQCGQAVHARRSLVHMAEEVLVGLFNFDTKIWRTLPMVIFRPGTLTNNFVYGKRARYISPLALFLLCVFFLFFVFSLMPPPANVNAGSPQREVAQDHLDAEREVLQEARESLREMRQDRGTAQPTTGQAIAESALEHTVATAAAAVARREAQLRQIDAAESAARARSPVQVEVAPDTAQTPGSPITVTPTPAATDAAVTTETEGTTVSASIDSEGPNSLEDAMRQISRDNLVVDGRPILSDRMRHKLANPELFFYQLQEAASKFSFLLVPISLPFIALLFLWKRGVTFYDHAVFALYSLCFASLVFVVVLTLGSVPWMQWAPGLLVGFGMPIHTFFHLGGAYKLGIFSALWRTFFMLIFAVIALLIFLAAILFVGLAG